MRNQQSTISSQHSAVCSQKSGPLKRLNAEGRMLTAIVLNESGIALMLVLVLSAISLAIMAGMIYMITQGTIVSGIEKRYKTALEASKGGTEVVFQFIGDRGTSNLPVNLIKTPTDPCLTDKLTKATANWNPSCDSSITINTATGNESTYDMSFAFGSYNVYSKIVDTVEGNSSPAESLEVKQVESAGSLIKAQSVPYLYTIEVHTENPTNIAERAKLSILYQY